MDKRRLVILAPSFQAGEKWFQDRYYQDRSLHALVVASDNFREVLRGVTITPDVAVVVKLYDWEDSFWRCQGGNEELQECMALIKYCANDVMPVIYNDSKELRASAYRTVKGRKARRKAGIKPGDNNVIWGTNPVIQSNQPGILQQLYGNNGSGRPGPGGIAVQWSAYDEDVIRRIREEERLALRVQRPDSWIKGLGSGACG